jgi:hypothetical protein
MTTCDICKTALCGEGNTAIQEFVVTEKATYCKPCMAEHHLNCLIDGLPITWVYSKGEVIELE